MKSRMMDRDDVCRYFKICGGTITRWIREEGFPKATRDGKNSSWEASQIENWVHDKKANPPANPKFRAKIQKTPSHYQPPFKAKARKKLTRAEAHQKPQKTLEQPKQGVLTINLAFQEQILQRLVDNLTAAIQPQIEAQTNQIINRIATDLLNNYGK